MTNYADENKPVLDDDYATAILGDPGLALRVHQLTLLKNGNSAKASQDLSKLLVSIAKLESDVVSANISENKDPRKSWSSNVIDYFKRKNGITENSVTAAPQIRRAS